MSDFEKYLRNGAYHWDHVSRSLDRHVPFTQARYDSVLAASAAVRPQRVLDLGCGDGALTAMLARRGSTVIGLDLSELGVSLASAKMREAGCPSPLLRGDAQALPFAAGSFDLIVAVDVIEHVPEASTLVSEVVRCLAPGGLFVVSTPQRVTNVPIDREHVREFYADELGDLLAAGLNDVRVAETHPLAFAEIFWRWRKHRVFRVALNAAALYLDWNPFRMQWGRFHVMLLATAVKT